MARSELYSDSLGKVHEKPAEVAPRWRISAYALVGREGKYLMVKQMGNPRWELPGGGVEIHESAREGVIREVYEETGYRVSVEAQPMYVGERNFYGTRAQTFFKNILLVYRGELLSEQQDRHVINTVIEDEISETAWVVLPDITAENCHQMFWPVIEGLKRPPYQRV